MNSAVQGSVVASRPALGTWLYVVTLSLTLFGLVMVYSATIAKVGNGLDASLSHLVRHGGFVVVGILAMVAISRLPISLFQRLDRALLLVAMIGLVLVLVPQIGDVVNGSRRWIPLGPITVQPSEIMKVVFVVYFAAYLSRRGDSVKEVREGIVVPGVLLLCTGGLLLAEPDFGSFFVLVVTAGTMLFLSGMRMRHFLGCFVVAMIGVGILIAAAPYRVVRMTTFLRPFDDPQGAGFQLAQALIASGRGGLTGVGLGGSIQKLAYLPHANNDFLISILAEELGFIGVVSVIALFVGFLWLAFALARRATRMHNLFVARLAQGLGVLVAVQALINIGVNLGALPTKGLTLPFVGTGGSSLVMNSCAVGLLLSAERATRARTTPAPRAKSRSKST